MKETSEESFTDLQRKLERKMKSELKINMKMKLQPGNLDRYAINDIAKLDEFLCLKINQY